MYVPGPAGISSSPTVNVNSPSRMKNDSSISRCRCGTVHASSLPANSAGVNARAGAISGADLQAMH